MDFGFFIKVDEDEGSPLRNGANDLLPLLLGEGRVRSKNRTISGSPSGTPYPSFFPSKENPAHNIRRQLRGQKAGSGKK